MIQRKWTLLILTIALIYGCKVNKGVEDTLEKPDQTDEWLWAASWNTLNGQISVGGTEGELIFFSEENTGLIGSITLEGTITKTKWHPTENLLAVTIQNGKTRSFILDTKTKERITLDSLPQSGARAVGWNNNGDLLAVGDYEGFLTIYNKNGEIVKRIDSNQKSLIGLDWHPIEDKIVAVGERILIYDMEKEVSVDIKHRVEDVLMLCVSWHPTGNFFVTGDYGDFIENHPPLLQYWSARGENIINIREGKAEYRNIKWSYDGSLLATASESLRLWDKDGKMIKQSVIGNLLWGLDWNKSSNQIVTTDEKGNITIWDKDLKQLQELKYR